VQQVILIFAGVATIWVTGTLAHGGH